MGAVSRVAAALAWIAWLHAVAACSGDGSAAPIDAGSQNAASAGSGGAPTSGAAGSAVAVVDAGVVGVTPDAGAGAAGSSSARAPDATVDTPVADAGSERDAGQGAPQCGVCDAYAAPMRAAMVESTELNALSGLAVSRGQPEIVFAHNDHDRAVVYALDLQGRTHARISLDDAAATDIEDIAVGPCGADSCVYLADIGDNAATRGEYVVLRFAEPSVPNEPGSASMNGAVERYRFRYEDGSHNAEALMVAPDGAIYVVTKLAPGTGGKVAATGPSSVYKLAPPLSTSSVAVATKLATLPIPASNDLAASAAAAHPCGLGFLVRTYDKVYEFRAPAGAAFEAAFSATPRVVAMPDEPQSEGIDYRADGRGFVSSGEGSRAPLYLTACD